MKHAWNITVILVMALFQLIMTVIGWVLVVPFLKRVEPFECEHEASRPNVRFKDKWIDSIFGNSEDGLGGDIYYKAKYKELNLWTRYNWVAHRNPIHNLALKMGVNEVIMDYNYIGNRYTEDRIGYEGFLYSEAKGISGRVYPMYRWCKLFYKNYGIEANLGYKNFNIKELGVKYKYSFTVSINPFKKFEE